MTERDETTRPLTAPVKLATALREAANRLNFGDQRMHESVVQGMAVSLMQVAADALDAREGQTCGTCKCGEFWNEGLRLCTIGVRRDTP